MSENFPVRGMIPSVRSSWLEGLQRDTDVYKRQGLYRANVGDLHEDYIRPQENGSHYDCEYVELNLSLIHI